MAFRWPKAKRHHLLSIRENDEALPCGHRVIRGSTSRFKCWSQNQCPSVSISVHQPALHSFPGLRSLGEVGSGEGWFQFSLSSSWPSGAFGVDQAH